MITETIAIKSKAVFSDDKKHRLLLKKEWDKYPVNYIDSVIGLYKTRQETILTWNPSDLKTRKIIDCEYICNVIKALEMSYSPKMKLDRKQRKVWINEQIQRSNMLAICVPENLGKYQSAILSMFRKEELNAAMALMRLKVEIEKKGLLDKLRR